MTPREIALGPEGTTAYAVGPSVNEIAIFTRDPFTGALTRRPGQAGCIRSGDPTATCAGARVLTAPTSIRISPDGTRVYVGSMGKTLNQMTDLGPSGVEVFTRDTGTGTLTPLGGPAGCVTDDGKDAKGALTCTMVPGIPVVGRIAVSRDGGSLYAVGNTLEPASPGYLAAFSTSGGLSAVGGCFRGVGAAAGCAAAPEFSGTTNVIVAPDGKNVYASNWHSSSVVGFGRLPSGALTGPSGCAQAVGNGGCTPVAALSSAGCGTASEVSGLAFHNDRLLYASTRCGSTIALLDRSTTGTLAQHPGTAGCVSANSALALVCRTGTRLYATSNIALTPDGNTLVAAATYGAQSITAYDIEASGALARVPGPTGCLAAAAAADCQAVPGIVQPWSVVISPDGRFGYTAPDDPPANSIIAFRIDAHAPVCEDRSASTTADRVVTVSLSCTDADGDPMVLTAGTPSSGVVGGVDSSAQSVVFAPAPGFTGQATFTYTASDGARTSAPATVTVEVQAEAVTPVPTATATSTPQVLIIGSPILNRWTAFKTDRYVTVRRLVVSEVPTGATVEVRCRGGRKKGCPFTSRKFRVTGGRVVATGAFKKARLRKGAVVEVRITRADAVGKVVRYAIRNTRKEPSGQRLCVPVGKTTAVKSC